jgi:type IV pilus assembly protein PilW
LTLIELMIGILIGLLVSIAAVASLGFTRLAASTVGDSARLHEDANTAFRIIGHHLRQAGAQRLLNTNGRVEFNNAFVGFGDAAAPRVIQGVNTTNDGPDTLSISHDIEPLLGATDCMGDAPTALQVKDDGITTLNSVFSVDDGNLQCTGSIAPPGAALIRGVEDFQVRYAVRDATDALQYVDAPADWNSVEGVMVCLQLVGELGGQPTAPIIGCNSAPSAQDGRFRRAFWRVFKLRNSDA